MTLHGVRLGGATAALAAAAMLAGAALAGQDEALAPYQMVRSLQMVQDRIAAGDHAALPMQRKLLEMIDTRVDTADREEFADPRNFRSLLIYAMSGGNPRTLDHVLARLDMDDEEKRLASGVLNYVSGRPKAAKTALEPIEPLKAHLEIGAFVALVKGAVSANDDASSAAKALDQAILLAPGTLVEEAALRRRIGIATELHDAGRFLSVCDQYVRRFLRSPYASQFADAFVAGIIAMHDKLDRARLTAIVAGMDPEQQNVIYLRVARQAAIEGKTDLSAFASAQLMAESARQTQPSDPRASLYNSLVTITSGTREEMLPRLKAIDRSRLSTNDRLLLDAAEAVAAELTAELPPSPPKPAAATPVEAAGTQAAPDVEAHTNDDAATEAGVEGAVDEAIPESDIAASQPASHDDLAPVEETAPHAPAAQESAAAPAEDGPDDPVEEKLSDARAKLEAIDKLLGDPNL
ncbi:MAG: chemotaxis protein MotC [Rhizobiaceae bacterium]|nr:chemotaxis protein MotC [Rhizobiaceae bacterium]